MKSKEDMIREICEMSIILIKQQKWDYDEVKMHYDKLKEQFNHEVLS